MKNEAKVKKLLKELHKEIRKYYEEELGQQRVPEADDCKFTQYGSATFAWVPQYTNACGTIEAHTVARLTVCDSIGDFAYIEVEIE